VNFQQTPRLGLTYSLSSIHTHLSVDVDWTIEWKKSQCNWKAERRNYETIPTVVVIIFFSLAHSVIALVFWYLRLRAHTHEKKLTIWMWNIKLRILSRKTLSYTRETHKKSSSYLTLCKMSAKFSFYFGFINKLKKIAQSFCEIILLSDYKSLTVLFKVSRRD
jgi:hypothetical protein